MGSYLGVENSSGLWVKRVGLLCDFLGIQEGKQIVYVDHAQCDLIAGGLGGITRVVLKT